MLGVRVEEIPASRFGKDINMLPIFAKFRVGGFSREGYRSADLGVENVMISII
jgi:hypothetical protein